MIQRQSQESQSQVLNWNLLHLAMPASRALVISAIGFVLTFQLWAAGAMPANATGVYNMPIVNAGDTNWLIDEANVLSRLSRNKLNTELADLATTTGKEVRFVTIHRLDYGETIDSFTEALFQKWFPTPEAQSNQVLIGLDNVTNTIAIRTGAAVKAVLPDEIASSVAQETMMVPLRDGNKYNQAFLDASDRLLTIFSGQPDPGAPVVENNIDTEGTFAKAEETDDRSATITVIVLLLLATVIPMATYYLYQAFQS